MIATIHSTLGTGILLYGRTFFPLLFSQCLLIDWYPYSYQSGLMEYYIILWLGIDSSHYFFSYFRLSFSSLCGLLIWPHGFWVSLCFSYIISESKPPKFCSLKLAKLLSIITFSCHFSYWLIEILFLLKQLIPCNMICEI